MARLVVLVAALLCAPSCAKSHVGGAVPTPTPAASSAGTAHATAAYYASLQNTTSGHTVLAGLGDAAFAGTDGSIVVRKDFKVLHVDVSGLREPFGPAHLPRAVVAYRIAAAIMACWTGN